MKVAFFQAAMLAVAVTAADDEPSYFPDLLVQTASIVDYFFPFNNDEEQGALAQSNVDIDTNIDADIEAEAQAEADVESSADSAGEAEGEVEADSESELDSSAMLSCGADADCIASQLEGKKGLTRINMKDTYGQDLNVIMPNIHRKRVTYETPKLEVEPSFFNQTPVKVAPIKVAVAPQVVVGAPDVDVDLRGKVGVGAVKTLVQQDAKKTTAPAAPAKPAAAVEAEAEAKKKATPQTLTMDTPGLTVSPAIMTDGDVQLPIVNGGIPVKSGKPLAPNPTANFNVNTDKNIKATSNNDGTAIRLSMNQAPAKAAAPAAPAKPQAKAQVESENEGEAFDGLW